MGYANRNCLDGWSKPQQRATANALTRPGRKGVSCAIGEYGFHNRVCQTFSYKVSSGNTFRPISHTFFSHRICCFPSALLKCSGRRAGTQTLPAVWSALWGANEPPQYDRLTKQRTFVSGKMGLCVTPALKWTRTGNQTKIVVHACYKQSFMAWC